MKLCLIEATNGFNWGKFAVGRMDDEWHWTSSIELSYGMPLLDQLGWTHKHLWVLDLQTGEGAFFKPGGYAKADLDKHKIWVCPLFEPFLTWLYDQDLADLTKLPAYVELPHAEPAPRVPRRPGPAQETQ